VAQLPTARAAQRRLDMEARGVSSFEARGCMDKRTYASRAAAKHAARVMRGQGRNKLTPYTCPHCSLFHLCKPENHYRKRSVG
jgi:hypothetical protein